MINFLLQKIGTEASRRGS